MFSAASRCVFDQITAETVGGVFDECIDDTTGRLARGTSEDKGPRDVEPHGVFIGCGVGNGLDFRSSIGRVEVLARKDREVWVTVTAS